MASPPSVLLVDDDEETCKFLMAAFRALGMPATCAFDATSARIALELCRIDVGIVDAHLADGSGLSLARDIAATGTPTVLMMAMDDVVESVPGAAVLYKPFRLEQLLRKIAALASYSADAAGAWSNPAGYA